MADLLACFSALADQTRFSIVEQLMRDGEQAAGELIEGRGMSGAAISRHLKILREAGLIRQRIKGPQRLYSIHPRGFRQIAEWTMSKRVFWETSLDRLDDALIEERDR